MGIAEFFIITGAIVVGVTISNFITFWFVS